MKLRTRLFALVSGLVALTVVLATWSVSTTARRSFAALDAERTAALVSQFRREFASEAEQIALRVERIAATDAVMRTASGVRRSRADYAAYVNEAAPLASAQGLEFLDLVAADGTIVSSAHWPARFGYRHPWAAAAPAAGAAFLQTIELPRETALALVAVRKTGAADPPLYVAGGRRLDEHFLQSLALPAGMRALLYRNIEPESVHQPLIDASGRTLDVIAGEARQLEPLIARARQSGRDASATIEWPDGPEHVDAIPLTGRSGSVVGVLLVGSSGRELAALLRRIRWSGVVFGGIGILTGFILSYAVAARVTQPVEELAAGARAVAAGEWDVRLDDVAAAGEIDDLARAFGTMTRQLVDQRERLIQAERVAAWRELARRLAHELKNPLFPLRLTVDNLRRAKELSDREFAEVFDEGLQTLTTGLANLNTVIGRFSDFAKMPAPQLESVGANELVQRSLQLFRAQLEAPDRAPVAVTVHLDPTMPVVRADAEQLGRALQNLLLNAIDAMPDGGTLTVRTIRTDGSVRFEVSDTGAGLTDEERSRLFTPYYTTKQHGTGLGLAIVQSVVADHGGRIWVDSAPGRGTTFHVEIPNDERRTTNVERRT
jgi:signal transduction histidine kinase